ncbi:MAG: TlyA family RNA methyltransferase [Acidimicrobiia bacterium]|nr:TlyA family RNA methyltransferase [Acidimicrobiia bacterium]MYC57841.1 TlyA family RNA methyltransferase [Acidimicrobiia bacterium]MYI30643.1 TlyA family RNA methyltransferase [Acidimicrobiia bacterium]
MSRPRRRLDVELVRRGLIVGRDQAKQAVAYRRVTVNGAIAHKAAQLVLPGDAVEVAGSGMRYVSRGGEKLQSALEFFSLDPMGLRCCDVGASTGGFTDCLLQNGATEVVAVDVGRAQIHERIASDARVHVYERTDIRNFDFDQSAALFDLVTVDVSFISLTLVMPSVVCLAARGASVVVLVKPQFEVGRRHVARGRGVIRDPELWQQAIDKVLRSAASINLAPQAAAASVLKGAQGNAEFFLHLIKNGIAAALDSSQVVAQAVMQAQ